MSAVLDKQRLYDLAVRQLNEAKQHNCPPTLIDSLQLRADNAWLALEREPSAEPAAPAEYSAPQSAPLVPDAVPQGTVPDAATIQASLNKLARDLENERREREAERRRNAKAPPKRATFVAPARNPAVGENSPTGPNGTVPPATIATLPPNEAPITKVVPGPPGMPMNAARTFILAYFKASGMRELYYWQSVFMAYKDGVYVETSEDAMHSLAWPFFENAGAGVPLKSKDVNEILKALRALTYLPEKTPVPCWLDAPEAELPDLLICRNGAFDLVSGDVHPLTPRLFATIRLPVEYTPEAAAPVVWLAFLKSLWPNDQESIDALQEIFGLLLTPLTKFQKIFLLVGPKRSGKGTILRMMRKLLGDDNVASPALSTIAESYGMQCMIGKLAALIGDARINVRSDKMSVVVERLLSISGEDSPNVQRKFLPDWTGRLPTRVVMSSNELPHLDDPSGAMASRFVILVLRESFIGREDLELESKLAPEMPAILNWAIEGRRRLLERGRFVQPASGADAVEQMAELSSTINKFVRECCTVGAGLKVPKADLYAAWRTWCGVNGERPTHAGLFGRDLIAAYPTITPARPRDKDGKPIQVYAGIGLTDPVAAPVSDGINPGTVPFGKGAKPASLVPPPPPPPQEGA
jgi:putative DNA primase/helicase